ncbi:MAG: carotenoid 1,2-hydratase [Verrucomicrobiaceae bacterium]|nr:carotenoid 1,2-hydratase [Verrucomicrobiaceae bacterium]
MKPLLSILVAALPALAIAQSPHLTADGFALPQPHPAFVFPRDHGSHPDFRTEWWYVTGHLDAADGRHFGFQATFFRQASPARQQLYLAHAALLDVSTQQFISEERLNRAGWDASSSVTALDIRNGNWSLAQEGHAMHLSASIRSQTKLELKLLPSKPLVIFGEQGVSKKGASPEAASHYLTYPRIECSGVIDAGNGEIKVTGQAWMDHEFSSSQLDRGQAGWDWASLQLKDGHEIMVYRMRRQDGSSDPAGTFLSWVQADGSVTQEDSQHFTWQQGRSWTSPKTHAVYPIGVRITTQGQVFELRPLADAQELDGIISGLPYWEGACDVVDAQGKVVGRAFLELAGYAGDLGKHLRGVR